MKTTLLFLPVLSTLAFAAPIAAAQTVQQTQPGTPFTWWGHGGAIVGDVNNDGFCDYAAGADYEDTNGANAGRVFVYSGKTGTLLYAVNGEAADDRFGSTIVGAGDINNDGNADLWVGAAFDDNAGLLNCGSVALIHGVTGARIYTVYGTKIANVLGSSLAASPDINGDGKLEMIAGGYGYNSNDGFARVYSGATGATLATFLGAAQENLGTAVAGPGDVNGDGVPDVAIGASGYDLGTTINIGKVYIYSGASWTLLYNIQGTVTNQGLGGGVGRAGDLNQDGLMDYLCGIPNDNTAGLQAGKLQVRSGANGAILYEHFGTTSDSRLGYSPAGGVDLNGDGVADYAASHRITGFVGGVRIFSGANGSVISTKTGSGVTGDYGTYAINCDGDVNGDGLNDLLVTSAPHYADSLTGYVDIWAFIPPFVTLFGTGTPGCDGAHLFSTARTPHVGDAAWPIVCTRMPAASLGACFITDIADVAGSDPFAIGLLLHVDLFNSTEFINLDVPTDAHGFGMLQVAIPNDANLINKNYTLQMIDFWGGNPCNPSPLGLSSSNGMTVTLQN